MDIEKVMQYECKVCGRRIDVTRSGDVYEEPIFCCGVETSEVAVPGKAPAAPKPRPAAKKKPAKKAKKKVAKKKAVKKKAVKKKAAKKTKKKAAKKKAKKAKRK